MFAQTNPFKKSFVSHIMTSQTTQLNTMKNNTDKAIAHVTLLAGCLSCCTATAGI